jgi:signal transduction histidine kinase/DNA-binding LacI/PurR family transcriptional regulator/DNA-binding response OmpR family regulator
MSAPTAVGFYLNPRWNRNVGYSMALGASSAAAITGRRLIIAEQEDALEDLPLAGLLFFDMTGDGDALARRMIARGVPVVSLARPVDDSIPTVLLDNQLGSRRLTETLLAMGHREIAFLGGVEDYWENHLRLTGVREVLASANLELPRERIFHVGGWELPDAVRWGERIAIEGHGITALVCANDRIAQGAIMGIRQAGLRVPEDISVVGFDNFAFRNDFDPEFSDPPLTTLVYPGFEIGCRAFQWLFEGGTEPVLHVPPPVILRKSVCLREGGREPSVSALDYVISPPMFEILGGRHPARLSIAELGGEIFYDALGSGHPLEQLFADYREVIYRGLNEMFGFYLLRKSAALLQELSPPADDPGRRRLAAETMGQVIAKSRVWHYRDFHSALQNRVNGALLKWHRKLSDIFDFKDVVAVADEIRRTLGIRGIQLDGRGLAGGGMYSAVSLQPMSRRLDISLQGGALDSLLFHDGFHGHAVLRRKLNAGAPDEVTLEVDFNEARSEDCERLAQEFESLLLNARLNSQLRDHALALEARNDELVLARARAEEARLVAEQASKVKGEFLANMSHEIRTPMNGILGMAELTLDTDLTAQQQEYLNLIKSSTFALLTIINDILDFSKIESGRFHLEEIPFSLRDTFDDTIRALGIQAAEKGLELIYDVRPDVPDSFQGDPGRLRQILNNLVGNAIKFTPEGEIVVRVEAAHPIARDHCSLRIEVRDTGIGIAVEKLDVIFESFRQADNSTSRVYGGTGLGLAISARLVEQMGGSLSVESELGRGSTFHFVLKLPLAPQTVTRHQDLDPSALVGQTALVIDDNALNLEIFRETLEAWGVDATLAAEARSGLEMLRFAKQDGRPYDFVLLDVVMPGMDGFEVARTITAEKLCERTALVMLSSAFRGNEFDGAKDDCQIFLTKPVTRNELLRAIHSALRLRVEPADRPRPSSTAGRLLRILLAEDNHVSALVASRLLQQRGHEVVIAQNGREAVSLFRTGGFDLVLMDMHMPEMDGDTAAREIRRLEQDLGTRIPIIAQTANAMMEVEQACLAAGMDAYVSKPIVREKFIAVVESFAPAV